MGVPLRESHYLEILFYFQCRASVDFHLALAVSLFKI